jgi:hypothetical protein
MEIKELMCECGNNAQLHPQCANFPITSFHCYLVILFSVNVKYSPRISNDFKLWIVH